MSAQPLESLTALEKPDYPTDVEGYAAERLRQIVVAGEQSIRLAERHMRLLANALPSQHHKAMREVLRKLTEARLWLGEIADRG